MNEQSNNNSSDILVHKIDDTPFNSVQVNNNDYVVVFGKYMINPRHFYSHEECCAFIRSTDWTTTLNVIGIMIDNILEQKKYEHASNANNAPTEKG